MIDRLLDMLPTLLAGFALFGPTLGLDNTTGQPVDLIESVAGNPGAALALAVFGLVFGFDRARHRGNVRLGLGIFCCAIAASIAALELYA